MAGSILFMSTLGLPRHRFDRVQVVFSWNVVLMLKSLAKRTNALDLKSYKIVFKVNLIFVIGKIYQNKGFMYWKYIIPQGSYRLEEVIIFLTKKPILKKIFRSSITVWHHSWGILLKKLNFFRFLFLNFSYVLK